VSGQPRIGLSLPNRGVLFGLSPDTLLDSAVDAERSGLIESIWVGDNLMSKPRLEALVLLAAVAGRTERVRLGTICMASFPLRQPLLLAIQWASLDVLSGGRTTLGVCIGGSARDGAAYAAELKASGIASDERIGRMEEGVAVLRRLWSGEPIDHEGRYYKFTGAQALPRPAQQRVPVLLAANPLSDASPELEERVLRRIARIANGWQSDGTPVDVFESRWRRILEYAEEAGRRDELIESNYHLMVNINEDVTAARREALMFLDRYYGAVGGIPDEKMEVWLGIGPPARVADTIRRYLAAGCTTPVIRLASPDQKGQLDRLLAEVLPQLP
jgi:alkanesulfonate monooxygenase SsuD/methylene tetrahydromethanopterin reductase-like flavin-dependent oxidoreductase (luciferase family)